MFCCCCFFFVYQKLYDTHTRTHTEHSLNKFYSIAYSHIIVAFHVWCFIVSNTSFIFSMCVSMDRLLSQSVMFLPLSMQIHTEKGCTKRLINLIVQNVKYFINIFCPLIKSIAHKSSAIATDYTVNDKIASTFMTRIVFMMRSCCTSNRRSF